jgi:hypothetical protein
MRISPLSVLAQVFELTLLSGVVVATTFLPSDGLAAVIHLKSGGEITADTWKDVGDELELTIQGGTIRVPKVDVDRIEAASAPATSPGEVAGSMPRSATVPSVPPSGRGTGQAIPANLLTTTWRGRTVADWQHDLASPAVESRRVAADRLAGMVMNGYGSVVLILADALKDSDLRVRVSAAVATAMYRYMPTETATALASGLGADDLTMRKASAMGLMWMGTAAKDATPALLRALSDDTDPTVRDWAAGALAGIGPADPQVIPGLTSLLQHRDANVRRIAVATLGRLGADAKPAVPALREAGDHDPDNGVRSLAKRAVQVIDGW